MKQMEVGSEGGDAKLQRAAPPPPPPMPLPNFWANTKPVTTVSVTNQEIARFWRQKRIDEEDHLLSAIKAAARIRAQKLTVQKLTVRFDSYFFVIHDQILYFL